MIPALVPLSSLDGPAASEFDALVLAARSPLADHAAAVSPALGEFVADSARIDGAFAAKGRALAVLPCPCAPGRRLVLAGLGPLCADTDDVRVVAEVVGAAVTRAVEAGARRPLVAVVAPEDPRFVRALDVGALAALGSQWAPLEAREAEKVPPRAESVGVVGLDAARAPLLAAAELGRALGRDVTGTEPERMTPRAVATLCEQSFAGTGVSVAVEHDVSAYPLLHAVARASAVVERHRPCVVRLEYRPAGAVSRTVVIAGKGVTYDTGGADLKTDGHMAGMSRDKGGAGAAVGLMRALAALAPAGVRVVTLLGHVRNSIGEDAFVTAEIVRARSGARVRIGNTDAEGRLVLADLLSAGRELCAGAPDPLLLSVATLTGHVYRAYGPYVGVLGNGPARRAGVPDALARAGEAWGVPMDISRPRREDYALVAPRSCAEDVVSANRLASVNTPRGHQFPFAFLDIAAGLRDGSLPLVHLDVAGTAVDPPDWQFGRPTASPVLSLLSFVGAL